MLQNLVLIPKSLLRNLRIPAAIIGWGCHPLCVNLCNLWSIFFIFYPNFLIHIRYSFRNTMMNNSNAAAKGKAITR
jgi:hypothetical protein